MKLEAKFQKEHWIIISGILALGVIVSAYYITQSASASQQAAQQAAQSVENGTALTNAAANTISTWWASSNLNWSNW